MKRFYRLLAAGLMIALLTLPTLVAFAKQLSSLSISGPGIEGEFTLSDRDELNKLMSAGFFDTDALGKQPSVKLGTPYAITSTLDLGDQVIPFIEMEYYPAEPGTAGHIHVTGRIDGEELRKVDEWGIMALAGDKALRQVMSAHGLELETAILVAAAEKPAVQEPAQAQSAPATAPVRAQVPGTLWISIAIAVVVLLAAAGLALRRRKVVA